MTSTRQLLRIIRLAVLPLAVVQALPRAVVQVILRAAPAIPKVAVQIPVRPAAGTKALNQAQTAAIWVNPQRLGC